MKKPSKFQSPVEREISELQAERTKIKNKLSNPEESYLNPLEYSKDARRLREINQALNKFYLVSRGL